MSRIPPSQLHPQLIVFDFDFRPVSYSDAPDPVSAIIQNIAGQRRRDLLRWHLLPDDAPTWEAINEPDDEEAEMRRADIWRRGKTPNMLRESEPREYRDEMDRADISEIYRSQPERLDCGDDLPRYLEGEVEVARVLTGAFGTVPSYSSIVSVRARLRRHGIRLRYNYRTVTQGRFRWGLERATSVRPLTMGQLIRFIDGIEAPRQADVPFPESRVHHYLDKNPHIAGTQVRVESYVYPNLQRYYARRLMAYAIVNHEEYVEGPL